MKDPFAVVKTRYVTEKATVLQQLQTADSNRSVARCKSPKYVFTVANDATKRDIAEAVEAIFREEKITVTKVNTIQVKGKSKKRGKGRRGMTPSFKKAIVTLEPGDTIDKV